MDDIITIIIYIVILAAGGIISALKKRGQQKRHAPSPSVDPAWLPDEEEEPKRSYDPFEEIFKRLEEEGVTEEDDFEEASVQPDYKPEYRVETKSVTEPAQHQIMEPARMEIAEEGISAFAGIKDAFGAEKEVNIDFIASSQIGDAIADAKRAAKKKAFVFDDPRKAIIYHEILKRKKF